MLPAFARLSSAMEVTVNAQEVLAKCGNDTKLLGELCKLFVEDSSRLIKTLGDAVANRDADAIQRTAHTLRGSTQFFSTCAAVESLKELEAITRRGALGEADKVFARLVQEMNGVREATARLPAEVGPAEDAVGVS
jgi:HPt (histidine-containing phosphotransfer) domain-containing protein